MKLMISKFLTVIGFVFCCLISVSAQTKDDARPIVDDSKTKIEADVNPNLPTLFIVGDSTVKSDAPLRGWGQELAAFFDLSKINIVNRAIGGRSSRTFQNENRWDKVLSEIKKGDFVIIQFGHNDVGKYDDPAAKERPSIHGEGEETVEVTKANGTKEIVHTFGWYMRKYGNDAKAKGATVVFCSMVPHEDWKDGKIVRNESETFVKWTMNAAKSSGAAFINLNEMIALEFERLGTAKVESFFADKRTHSTPSGTLLNAQMVVAGLSSLKNPKLKKYFSRQGKNIKKQKRFTLDAS